jgi:Na+/H+ antiporter NhaA
MTGAALLAGTGFTMSLFAAGLAFAEDRLVDEAKLDVLAVYERWSHFGVSARIETGHQGPETRG